MEERKILSQHEYSKKMLDLHTSEVAFRVVNKTYDKVKKVYEELVNREDDCYISLQDVMLSYFWKGLYGYHFHQEVEDMHLSIFGK